MVKLTLTFKDLVTLVKTELQDKFNEFEQMFIHKLSTKCDFMQMKTPSPVDYSSALLECIQQTNLLLSPTIKKMVSDFNDIASTFIIPNKSNRNQTSPKADNKPTSSKSPKLKDFSVSRTKVSTSSTSCKTQLSAKKTKLVKKFIEHTESENSKLYSSCKAENCKEICPKIVRLAPITACTHTNPHPGGHYPHVSRKVIRKIHQFKDYTALLTLPGISNPLNVQTSEAEKSKDVDMLEFPLVGAINMSSSTSKKRKLDERTDLWSWVGNTLRAHNEPMKILKSLLQYLVDSNAPAELRKAVQKWNTLSEAERKEV